MLTPKEVFAKAGELRSNQEKSLIKIAEYARTLVHLLRDKGLEHVAKELEAKLFVYDSQMEESHSFGREHFDSLINALKREGLLP